MRLTPTQRECLALMVGAHPNPVRGGMGTDGRYSELAGDFYLSVNSGTASSLVRHGLARRAERPADTAARRGSTWYGLTDEGVRVGRLNVERAIANLKRLVP